jgi:hypothetical protein
MVAIAVAAVVVQAQVAADAAGVVIDFINAPNSC